MSSFAEEAGGAVERSDSSDDYALRRRSREQRSPEPAANGHLSRLIRTLEGEIIPRLMLVHGDGTAGAGPAIEDRPVTVEDADIDELSRLVVHHDAQVSLNYCKALESRGVSIQTIYLDLLTPVARRLGDLWERDEHSFAEVTLGLCRLHSLLRDLGPNFHEGNRTFSEFRRALVLPAPGEQHMFGAVMVAEFFRRAGWDVRSGPAESPQTVEKILRDQWFCLVGLSVSTSGSLETLPGLIERLRKCSLNRDVAIFVGGPVFLEDPELVSRVGADGTGDDASVAALRAENLLAMMA